MRRTVQTVKQLSRGVGMALVAAGAVVAGIVYAARKQNRPPAASIRCQSMLDMENNGQQCPGLERP